MPERALRFDAESSSLAFDRIKIVSNFVSGSALRKSVSGALAALVASVLALAMVGPVDERAAEATQTPTISVGATSLKVGQATNLGITLSGFSETQQQENYQVTLKYVDANGVDQDNGTLTATQSGTSLVTGYSAYSASKLGFKGTYAQVATALASVTWTPTQATSGLTLRIGLSTAPGTNQFYDANSGHYYEFVPSQGITATSAFSEARTKTLFGLSGYLVHITSRAENDFIANETSASNIWIGATDSAVEGEWRWDGATIPGESDFVFGTYAGSSSVPTSSANGWGLGSWYPSRYAGWASGEPNNSSNEDYAVTNWSGVRGQWNDLAGTNSGNVSGYLVEFGGRANETLTALTLTKNAVMGASDAQATWTAPSSPTDTTTQTFGLSFNYDVTGIAAADFVNMGTATGCSFAPSAATATAGTPIQVVVSGCSTGTLQPRLLENSVSVAGGLVLPAATATSVTITLGDLSFSRTTAIFSATQVVTGSATPVTVTIRPIDASGRSFGPGASLTVTSSLGTVTGVVDGGDGTYTASILPGSTAGTARVSVTIGATTIQLATAITIANPPAPSVSTPSTQPQTRTQPVIPPRIVVPPEQGPANDATSRQQATQTGVQLNTTDPTKPITTVSGTLPVAVPGKVMVLINGEPQVADAEIIDDQTIRLQTADGLEFYVTAKAPDGSNLPLASDGSLLLTYGERLDVQVAGFQPQSELTVWLFSEPKQLGTIPVDLTGSATADLALGQDLPPGKHSLQVTGLHPDGTPRSVMVSVVVTEDTAAAETTARPDAPDSSALIWGISLSVAAIAGLALLILVLARRRRRES